MMTVIQLAKKSGLAAHVVRYYTRIGLLRPVCNPQNGYKMFVEANLARLRFIRQAQALGYTLDEIAEIFEESSQRRSPCPKVREIIERRIKENRNKVNELMALQKRMERALAQWSKLPDGIPDGRTVCHLIESVVKETNSA